MNDLNKQGQHRISQVYLKQFGYQKDGKWWISVYQVGKKHTEDALVEDFTKETNIFDLPFKDISIRRHFENSSSLIENQYITVISNLHNQKRLTPKDKDLLCFFVPNLMCRTKPFRKFIDLLLREEETRNKFIEEMTLFEKNSQEIKDLLKIIKIDFQLNIVTGILMKHLVTVLRRFKQVIIKDFGNNGWMTTDNPITLEKQGHSEWIMPLEAEIYFPLSKDFCLFMYYDKSDINSNPLRQLGINKINLVDFSTFDNITKKIVFNLDEFLIMPCQIDKTDVTGQTGLV